MTGETLGTTRITQEGMIAQDIEAKARVWAGVLDLPEIMITDNYERARTEYKGKPSDTRAKLAFFPMGQIELELIEPLGRLSTWQDPTNEQSDSLHHIAFEIQGMVEKAAYVCTMGLPLVQRGDYPGGRYAYVNSSARLGAILELLEND